VAAGSQIVLATHSPIVAATPGAAILELGEWGIRETTWTDLVLVDHWRNFLASPTNYLRRLNGER
jgi:predicted ATPase